MTLPRPPVRDEPGGYLNEWKDALLAYYTPERVERLAAEAEHAHVGAEWRATHVYYRMRGSECPRCKR